jgi:putative ABC transport system substrate-binding protein
MKRRELMLVLAGIMIAARALRAQQRAMTVIGYLGNTSPAETATPLAGFHHGLNQAGWVEGQNVAIEYRWAGGRFDRLPALAADLVDRKVDVRTWNIGGERRYLDDPGRLLRRLRPDCGRAD